MTLQTKKEIIDKSKGLKHDEYLQLFRILKENEVSYSENKNGILVNLEKVPNRVINRLKEIIDICYDNRETNRMRNVLYEQARRSVSEFYEQKIKRQFYKQAGANDDDERSQPSRGEAEDDEERRGEIEEAGESRNISQRLENDETTSRKERSDDEVEVYESD